MYDNARGGDDTLIGGAGSGPRPATSPYGDAFAMHDNSRGGNDTLIGGASDNVLTGDARHARQRPRRQ